MLPVGSIGQRSSIARALDADSAGSLNDPLLQPKLISRLLRRTGTL
jgi:hypothetical protein